MCRARRPRRIALASYARSPTTQSGRLRGRPRSCKSGIASTSVTRVESRGDWPAQLDGERHGSPVANDVALTPSLGPIGRTWTVCCPTSTARTEQLSTTARDQSMAPWRASQSQHGKVDEIPHAGLLPVAQASPARHPRTASQFLWQHLPRGAAAKDKENARETRPIRYARPSTVRSWRWNREKRFDEIPQRAEAARRPLAVHVTEPKGVDQLSVTIAKRRDGFVTRSSP
jgi:hypothetical protein